MGKLGKKKPPSAHRQVGFKNLLKHICPEAQVRLDKSLPLLSGGDVKGYVLDSAAHLCPYFKVHNRRYFILKKEASKKPRSHCTWRAFQQAVRPQTVGSRVLT